MLLSTSFSLDCNSQICFFQLFNQSICHRIADKEEEDSDSTQDLSARQHPEEFSEEDDEEERFVESFFPTSQEETQRHSNKHKEPSGKRPKKSKHSKESRGSSSQKRHSQQRGVLSDTAAQNRQNRRVENSASMSGSAGKRGKSTEKVLQDEIQKLQAQLEENRRNHEVELAQARNSAPRSKKRKGTSGCFHHQVPVNQELADRVAVVAGTNLWRTCKFLADEKQLMSACEIVMTNIPEVAGLVADDNQDKDDNLEAFFHNYGEIIARTINVKRGDVQSGLKKAYEARAATGASMPDPTQLGDVIRRVGLEFDPEDPSKNAENREWFLWYWEHLLPKVGGKNSWGHSIRCYGTISKHTLPDDPKKKYITSSDEALVLVLYENCGQRFPYSADCQKKGLKVDKSHKKYQSRWTDARAGQCKWGGWNLKGRMRYIELRGKISKAKRKEHVQAVEAHALGEIQAKYNIGTRQPAKKKGAKVKDFEGKEEGFATFGVESSDEETEEGEEEGGSSDFEELGDNYQSPPKKAREA